MIHPPYLMKVFQVEQNANANPLLRPTDSPAEKSLSVRGLLKRHQPKQGSERFTNKYAYQFLFKTNINKNKKAYQVGQNLHLKFHSLHHLTQVSEIFFGFYGTGSSKIRKEEL